MNAPLAVLVAGVLVLGAVVGVFVGQQYLAPEEEAPTQWQPEEKQPTRVATLDTTIDNSTFADFATAVDSNGSIASDTEKTGTITIYNNDTINSGDLTISLVNTMTGEEGLSDALEIPEVTVKITLTAGTQTVTKYLYKDGSYNDAYDFGTLNKNAYTSVDVTVVGESCDDDTFLDGKTYNCNLYVMQGTSYYEEVGWTFLT